MEKLNFKDEVKKLYDFTQRFYRFEQSPEVLLEEIKNLDPEDLEKQKKTFFRIY